jgi:hypothetical protein
MKLESKNKSNLPNLPKFFNIYLVQGIHALYLNSTATVDVQKNELISGRWIFSVETYSAYNKGSRFIVTNVD